MRGSFVIVVRSLLLMAFTSLVQVIDAPPASAKEDAAKLEAKIAKIDYSNLNPFGFRSFERWYGTNRTERTNSIKAIDLGLDWIAAQQVKDGSFRHDDDKSVNEGFRSGVTALCALAMMGRGRNGRDGNSHDAVLVRALGYLVNNQAENGAIGWDKSFGHSIYNHAFAALALVEAFGLSGDHKWRAPAQRALDFLALARNPYFGWRYGIRTGEVDTSVSCCCVLAILAAKRVNRAAIANGFASPLRVDEPALEGVKAWLDKIVDPDYGAAGYVVRGQSGRGYKGDVPRDPETNLDANTASALLYFTHIYNYEPRRLQKEKLPKLMTDRCLSNLPRWQSGRADYYYWFFATTAFARLGGKAWDTWREALNKVLLTNQILEKPTYRGSWDPIGVWSSHGGRLYSTAMAVLALEAPARTIDHRLKASMVVSLIKDKTSSHLASRSIVSWFINHRAYKTKSKDIDQIIRAACKHKHVSVRIAGIEAPRHPDQLSGGIKSAIRRCLSDTDSRVRVAAVLAVRRLMPKHKKLSEWLATAAKDKDPSVRTAATIDIALGRDEVAKRLGILSGLAANDPWARACSLFSAQDSLSDSKALTSHAVAALGSQHESIVRAGLMTLHTLPKPEAMELAPIEALLARNSPWIRLDACKALLHVQPTKGNERVLSTLQDLITSEDLAVVAAAMDVLHRIGGLEKVNEFLLVRLLRGPDHEVRRMVIDELGRRKSKRDNTVRNLALIRYSSLREAERVHAASAHSKAGFTEEQVLDIVARGLRAADTRMLATEALIMAGSASIPALLRELNHADNKNPLPVLHALQHLGFGASGAVLPLRAYLATVKDDRVKSEVITTLIATGDDTHNVQSLPKALNAGFDRLGLRRSILSYRQKLRTEPQTVKALCEAYKASADPKVRATALFVLIDHAWTHPDAMDVCVDAAWSHPDAHVRWVALFIALQTPKKKDKHLRAIVLGLSDEDPRVRSLCAEHIGIGWRISKATIDQLLRAMESSIPAARRAVGRLLKKHAKQAVPALIDAWKRGVHKIGAARAAGWCGPESFETIQQWLLDPDAKSRIAAAHGMGVLIQGNRVPHAPELILKRMQSEADPAVREALVRALWGHIGK